MKFLVTGGAGYIGSHIVYELIEQNHKVIIVDNLQTGFKKLIHPEATFYEGDIRNLSFLHEVFNKEKIDGVFHFAANSIVGDSMEQPLNYYNNNVYGSEILLQAMKLNHIECIVFSSTAAVYGNPEGLPIREESMIQPTSVYGETKRTMEKMISWCANAYNMNYICLRYFNACGAHPNKQIGELHNPETHLIPLVLQVALKERKELIIYGDDYPTKDGTCIRDYIHVCDLANAHVLAMEYIIKHKKSHIFNLGTEKGYSVKEIMEAVEDVCNTSIPYQIQSRREGDPAMLIASSEKAKMILGWEPNYTSVKEIIKTAWDFYQNINKVSRKIEK